ncbi:GATA transcription factor 9 [Senna tora]|uniref:GATA transcription factor 9 n=1 Tax=Senna tora TaxID=362788 RepID=A0A834TBT4_9FABA|nr:GATA transcription factor 9 [Senna tora]
MDVCRNVSVSGECQQEQVLSPSCSKLSTFSTSLDDLFSAQNTEVDVGLEWLSVFVEDCFSSPASCLLAPTTTTEVHQAKNTTSKPSSTPHQNQSCSLQKFLVPPGKARSKRKRLSAPRTNKDPLSIWSHHLNPQNEPITSDPPLLKQAYWLADSELIVPNKKEEEMEEKGGVVMMRKESLGLERCEGEISNGNGNAMPRRCSHCLAQRTPQWRAGPLGPKTLCNACGVRYKSGRLLPEYRPAKSPTFVSYLHSNSHKKVLEMRMSPLSSIPSHH